ncbi:MAG: hypothetical protein K2I49_01140, partial [Ureaplasma sp.]|nr:hypothetical protein [Ureaplasma sp.]
NSDYIFGFANNQANTTDFTINKKELVVNFNNTISLSNDVLTSLQSKVANYIQQKRIDYFDWLEHIQNKDSTYYDLISYIYSELNILSNNTLPASNIIDNIELIPQTGELFTIKIIPQLGYSFLSNSSLYDNGYIMLTDIDFYSYIQFTSDNFFVFNTKVQQKIDSQKYNPQQFNTWVTSTEFRDFLLANLKMANNNSIDLTKVKSIAYDIQSNIITISPETMYKFEIIGGSSQDVSVNSKGEILISNFDLFEHIEFVKLSDFFNGLQQFIVSNKFTFDEFSSFVADSNNLQALQSMISENLYISETSKLAANKVTNVSINNNNFTITLQAGYYNYSAQIDTNVTLSNNVLTVANLKFYTITNLVRLSDLFNFVQTTINTNKYTSTELSNYITNNQNTFKSNIVNNLYIDEYNKISANQVLSISTSTDENGNTSVLVTLNVDYIKYNLEKYSNITLQNDNTLVIQNLTYYQSFTFAKMTDFYNSLQNLINTNKFTKTEFSNYVTNSNSTLKAKIAENLYISATEKITVDKISSITFNSTTNILTIVLSSNYLKYTLPSTSNISLSGTTLMISNLRYYSYGRLIGSDNLFNTIQNRITSNKFTPSDFASDVSTNNSTLKTLVGNTLTYTNQET